MTDAGVHYLLGRPSLSERFIRSGALSAFAGRWYQQLLKRDRKLADLFYGKKPLPGLRDQSRSGRR